MNEISPGDGALGDTQYTASDTAIVRIGWASAATTQTGADPVKMMPDRTDATSNETSRRGSFGRANN